MGNYSTSISTGTNSAATNAGSRSIAANTGDCSTAINTGESSIAINTGFSSNAEASGKNNIAVATGLYGRARGAIGCAIVLVERRESDNSLLAIHSAIVDGEKIKADTWYTLRDGELVEAE